MDCLQNTYISSPTTFNKTIAAFICIAAITAVAISIIGLAASSSGLFTSIVQVGARNNGILLGTSIAILILDLFWLAAICKKRKIVTRDNEITPNNQTISNTTQQRKEKPSLNEQDNGLALYQLMTPKARELTPLILKQVPYSATLADNSNYSLHVTKYDWIATLGGWTSINLTMKRNFSHSFSQLDVSPLIRATCLILENCKGELPKGIEKLPLDQLHLKNADLESLPEYFSRLPLTVLQLDGCRMNRIPDEVFRMSCLEELQINNLKNQHGANAPTKLILDEQTCNKLKVLPHLKTLKIVNSGWEDSDLDDLRQQLSPIDIVLHYSSLELELQDMEKSITFDD